MVQIREYLRGLRVLDGELPQLDPGRAPERPEVFFVEWLTAAVEAGYRSHPSKGEIRRSAPRA